jgi:hypothetical protein
VVVQGWKVVRDLVAREEVEREGEEIEEWEGEVEVVEAELLEFLQQCSRNP